MRVCSSARAVAKDAMEYATGRQPVNASPAAALTISASATPTLM